jgi:hypothetical protein
MTNKEIQTRLNVIAETLLTACRKADHIAESTQNPSQVQLDFVQKNCNDSFWELKQLIHELEKHKA